ncbi:MAG: FGGY family carbohydrate kinase [Gammaproteobacteria bacterium]|nr:FGGY family carbohydrate kinase [Gammaproteobacteria bacterium]
MPHNYSHNDDLYLAIDQGGQSSRAIIFDQRGQIIAQAQRDVEAYQPGPDRLEYEPLAMLDSISQSIDDVLNQLGERRYKITAAGLATQRSNICCWDRQTGDALSPILSWQDRRAHKWLQQFQSQTESIHKKTGLFMTAHYGASKLRWCLDNIPSVQQAYEEHTLALGPMASFIISNLVQGNPLLTDPINASRTQLLNIKTGNWDHELIKLFGLPIETLPQCVPNLFDYGTIQIDDCPLPLKLVTGDQSAAMYALGKLQPDTAYINIGTGAFVSRPSGQLQIYSPHLLTSIILHKDKQQEYVLEGTVNGAASALKWFAHQVGVEDIFSSLEEWLKQSENPPLFLNGVSGLGSPYWITDFPSQFIGEGTMHEQAAAIVESIVFLLSINLEQMRQLSSPPEQIQISGGLAQLNGLCQRIADISHLPVYRPLEAEATARGMAYLLADCPQHWIENEPGEWFHPEDNQPLIIRYRQWQEQMDKVVQAMNKDK